MTKTLELSHFPAISPPFLLASLSPLLDSYFDSFLVTLFADENTVQYEEFSRVIQLHPLVALFFALEKVGSLEPMSHLERQLHQFHVTDKSSPDNPVLGMGV